MAPLSSASFVGEVSFYPEHLVPSHVLLYLPVKPLPALLPFDFLVGLSGLALIMLLKPQTYRDRPPYLACAGHVGGNSHACLYFLICIELETGACSVAKDGLVLPLL